MKLRLIFFKRNSFSYEILFDYKNISNEDDYKQVSNNLLEKIRYLNSYRLSASLEAADKYTDNLLKYSSQENKESIKSIKTSLKDLKQKIDSVQTLGRQLSDAIQGFVNGMNTDLPSHLISRS